MVKLQDNFRSNGSIENIISLVDASLPFKKMENFILNGNGQIDIDRKVIETGYGFRLQEINHNTEICSNKDLCDDTTTSISSYSNYKQRIDAMFDDSRSVISNVSRWDKKRKARINNQDNDLDICKERKLANNIQKKIEKMFEDVSTNDLQRQTININATAGKELTNDVSSSESTLNYEFTVQYLGSRPLQDKNVSLMSLQDPLRELYFEFKKKTKSNQINILTVSKDGLKIKMADKEELNPFSTIAVWASVKLSIRLKANNTEFAFLPLITDPDGVDKNLLFKQLKNEDRDVAIQNFRGKVKDDGQSPIFTVVMKNLHLNKRLECHGFICKTSEEAIIIAANLYQALMKKLRRKKGHKERKVVRSDSKDGNFESAGTDTSNTMLKTIKKQPPPIPARPPRKPKPPLENEKKDVNSSVRNSFVNFKSEHDKRPECIEKLEIKDETFSSLNLKKSCKSNALICSETEPNRSLRRTVSDRGINEIIIKNQNNCGDILTKVAIPRSQSFLNANGPLSRFSRRQKTNTPNEILSPLGFKELFNEFRLHEGLESMDDILSAIIDPEGMSFNDLKPIYKEFLLKLAVTLTKDELYQRSKLIMRRQRKRNKNCSFRKTAFISTIGLNKVFRKTASRLGKAKTPKPTNLEFTSIVFHPNNSTNRQLHAEASNTNKTKTKLFELKRKQSNRRRLSKRLEKVRVKNLSNNSDESDFFRLNKNTHNNGGNPNRSSSGYFSRSECSYDSENCMCTSVEKCYCTLGDKKTFYVSGSEEIEFPAKKIFCTNEPEDSLKSCSCDTESCADSGKCYCSQNETKNFQNRKLHLPDKKDVATTCNFIQIRKIQDSNFSNQNQYNFTDIQKQTVFEQLKEQGFASPESTLSRAASPTTAWENNEENLIQKERFPIERDVSFSQKLPKSFPQMDKYLREQFSPKFKHRSVKDKQNTNKINRPVNEDLNKRTEVTSYRQLNPENSLRQRDFLSPPSFPCGKRRQYSSLRYRNEFSKNLNIGNIHRSASYRAKHFFYSVRSKQSCNDIMNHIKFPYRSSTESSLRFIKRMDVYNSFSEKINSYDPKNTVIQPTYSTQKEILQNSLTSDDLKFHLNKGNDAMDIYTDNSNCQGSLYDIKKKKVLVVSARDPKGKVLYLGTSNRNEKCNSNLISCNGSSSVNANEALAVKKSAEIAALFSDVTAKQKVIGPVYVKDQKQNNYRSRSISYRNTNLENSLGYLP